MLRYKTNFLTSEDGAVTVDWVVLTGAIVGLGLVVMATVGGGVKSAAGGAATNIGTVVASAQSGNALSATTPFNGKKATDYVAYGQTKAPGNNGAVYSWASTAASADAPGGYNFSNPLYDTGSGNVVYTSNDGANYSIGGNVVSKASYTGTVAYFGA